MSRISLHTPFLNSPSSAELRIPCPVYSTNPSNPSPDRSRPHASVRWNRPPPPQHAPRPDGFAGFRPGLDIETGGEEPRERKALRKSCATYYDEHVLESSYEQAAGRLVETGGGVFSHPVGMAVHFVRSDRQYEFLVTHARFATIVLRRV
jgi:hypothetical protein